MIHIYHGHGKGKTTAAIGLAVRASGAGKKVLFCQFMKGNISSEIPALRQLPQVQVELVGKAFGFYKNMTTQEKEEITVCHNRILQTVLQEIEFLDHGKRNTDAEKREQTAKHNVEDREPELVVVLDELTSAYGYGLLNRELVQKILLLAINQREVEGRAADGRVADGRAAEGRTADGRAADGIKAVGGESEKQKVNGEDDLSIPVELVITGRDPDPFFTARADYITKMKMERHPYEKGILARKGIEW